MKKYILTAALCLSFVSCAKNSLMTSPTGSVEAPAVAPVPTEPPIEKLPDDKNFEKLERDVAFYKGRYQLSDPYEKLTSDRGTGFDELYGTRNLREVLTGVYYRGGGNNKYHKDNPRSNTNPLPADGLVNLCKDGFALGLYFYDTNYKSAKPVNPCLLRSSGEASTLNYNQLTAFSVKDFKPFLQLIHDRIKGKLAGPIYGHCWNGWHASGMMAAIALKQYCGFSNELADAYWVKNTDGNSKGYESVRKKVNAFQKLPDLEITPEEQALICPKG